MQLRYQLTQKDFFDSIVAHRRRTQYSKWAFALAACLVVVFVVGGIVELALDPTAQTLSKVAPLFALSILWGLIKWFAPRRMARTQFLKQPSAQGPRTILLDATGVHVRWDGGSSDMEWKTFIRWLKCKSEVLLYSSPACFSMIPKRALDSAQLTELRAMLTHNIPSGNS